MGGCSAPNCKNRLGFRLFTFPKDEERKKIWLSNAKLDFVGPHARLCEVHFHDNQFEQQRQDGWKKLRHNANPTIFIDPIRVYRMRKDETEPSELIEVVTNVHQERKSKRLANKLENEDDVPDVKNKCKEKTSDEASDDDESICSQSSNFDVSEVHSIEKEPNNNGKRSILDDIKDENASLLDDIRRIQSSVKNMQSKTCLKESKHSENASVTTAKGNKLIALLKQWNVVLKAELRDLEQLHESVLITNEILQQDVQELEKQNQTLKCENNTMQDEMKEFEKRNKEMYLVINELEKHNKTLSDKLNDVKSHNVEGEISLKKENELLQNQKKELDSQNDIMVEENTSMLEEIQEFVKNNKTMTEVIRQLEKHNHAISCKLKDVQNENKTMSSKIKNMEKVIDTLNCKVDKRKKTQKYQGTKVKKKCLVEPAYS